MDKQEDQEREFKSDEAFEDSLDGIDWQKVKGEGVRVQPKSMRGRKKIGEKISLTLGEDLLERLKNVSGKRGIGYQTMIRLILNEKVQDYEKL